MKIENNAAIARLQDNAQTPRRMVDAAIHVLDTVEILAAAAGQDASLSDVLTLYALIEDRRRDMVSDDDRA